MPTNPAYARGSPGRYNGGGGGSGGSGGGGGGKKNAPPPPDFTGSAIEQGNQQRALLEEQTRANRPNQSSPFASSTWAQGPDGQWSQHLGFNGPLSDASDAIQQQLLQAMSTPLDFGGLPEAGSGDAAREQAINASYGQATSRLDPRFSRARDSERTRLLNQGLGEGSEAFRNAMGEFGNQENDAYNQAMFSAQREGRAAGESVFGQNMQRRNQSIMEMLRQRGQPLADAQGMQSLLGMPSFMGAGAAQAPNLLGAAGMQDNASFRNWQERQRAMADAYGGGLDMLGTVGSLAFLSDERAKMDLQRLPYEVVPGVSAVAFRYRPEFGLGTALHVGVSAQDLRRARPGAVRERPDGLLEVHPAFASFRVE